MSWMDKLVGGLRNLFANQEASLEEQWDAVVSAFYQLIDSGQPVGDIGDGFVSKVFADYIIVERSDGMLFQVDYTQTDEGIEFGEQTQVEMVYQPVSNEDEATAEGPETEMPTEEPAVNEDADESDEPAVNETVEETEPETESEPEPATNEMADQETDEEAVDEAAPDEEPATNRCQEYVNLVEFADSHGGPEWALTQLQESVELKAQARQSLIEALAANAAVAFTVEDLKEFGDEALEKLRLTVEAPQANYSGTPAPAKPKEAPTGRRTIKLPPMRG